MRRVVITGIGVISPIGNDKDTVINSLKTGKNGIRTVTHTDVSDLRVKIAGECDFDPLEHFDRKSLKRMDRVNQLAIVAARDAMKDSGLQLEDGDRAGCIMASGVGGFETMEKELITAQSRGYDKMSPFFISRIIVNMSAGLIAIDLGLHGYVASAVTACASGSNAVMDAYDLIRNGRQDVMLAGGAEACITHSGLGGFTSMRALCESNDVDNASMPFDKRRTGFVMGEGAACLVLEEYEAAKKRGAKIYAEIVGAEMTCDAYHITQPMEGGKYQAMAMSNAIAAAGIKPEDIDYINAHGTSTTLNDLTEGSAIASVFADCKDALSVSSTKSMTGHLLGAAGAFETAVCALAITESFIPPTINHKEADPDIAIPVVAGKMQEKEVNYAMNNSFGFGGHNVCIVLKKVD